MLYDDIKICPITAYENCVINSDVNYLTTDKKHKHNLYEVFQKLNDQLIDTFGLSHNYEKIFQAKYDATLLKLKWLSTDNPSYLNRCRQKELELIDLQKQTKEKPKDISKVFATNHRELSKWSGRDSRKLTMFEYYNDFNDFEKINGKKD